IASYMRVLQRLQHRGTGRLEVLEPLWVPQLINGRRLHEATLELESAGHRRRVCDVELKRVLHHRDHRVATRKSSHRRKIISLPLESSRQDEHPAQRHLFAMKGREGVDETPFA